MYSVVKFGNKELLEVPSSWIESAPSGKGFNCVWPQDSKAKDYIAKRREPGKRWKRLPVKVIIKECETLEAAKKKCDQFLEDSSSATEGGDTLNTLRRKSFTVESGEVNSRDRSRSPLKQAEPESQAKSSTENTENPPEITTQNSGNPPEITTQNSGNPPKITTQNSGNPPEITTQNSGTSPEIITKNTETQDTGNASSKDKNKTEKFTKDKSVNSLQDIYDIAYATYEVVIGNRSKLKSIMKQGTGLDSNKPQKENTGRKLVPAPLTKKEDVVELDEEIKKNAKSREILKSELKVLRSNDQSDYYRKMLHHIFAFSAAGHFTFKGQKRTNSSKLGFPSLTCLKALMEELLNEEFGDQLVLSKIEKTGDNFFRNSGTKWKESLEKQKTPATGTNTGQAGGTSSADDVPPGEGFASDEESHSTTDEEIMDQSPPT